MRKCSERTMGEIDWTMEAAAIERLIRGLNPWPSAYTHYGTEKPLKIWAAKVASGKKRTSVSFHAAKAVSVEHAGDRADP